MSKFFTGPEIQRISADDEQRARDLDLRLVVVESPYNGNTERNIEYARAAMRDCIDRGESPLVSHLLYTQVLDDNDDIDRLLGMHSGWAWIRKADCMVVYTDYGISGGMERGMAFAKRHGIPIEMRTLGTDDEV